MESHRALGCCMWNNTGESGDCHHYQWPPDFWYRADSRFAPSQWETTLLCNDVSQLPGASLESTLLILLGSPYMIFLSTQWHWMIFDSYLICNREKQYFWCQNRIRLPCVKETFASISTEFAGIQYSVSQIENFIAPIWGPPGSCRPQMGPMMAPWTLLSGMLHISNHSSPAWWMEECEWSHHS